MRILSSFFRNSRTQGGFKYSPSSSQWDKSPNVLGLSSHGGDDGIRTHDPLLAGQVLSQLSYTPILEVRDKSEEWRDLIFTRSILLQGLLFSPFETFTFTKWKFHCRRQFHFCVSKNFTAVGDFIANFVRLVGPSGLEPPTSCLSGTRSNLLSYEPMWLVSDFSHLSFFQLWEAFRFP